VRRFSLVMVFDAISKWCDGHVKSAEKFRTIAKGRVRGDQENDEGPSNQ
jgi:hypothetical protein